MCVDYTSLNKACPKDPFPLPRIDQIINSTSGCEILSFLDAYSGYHQIAMKESDQLATSFITPFGSYCYVSMPFGLKNVGATYQRCMQYCFSDQINPSIDPDRSDPPGRYPKRHIHKSQEIQHQVESREMHIRCAQGQTSQVHGVRAWHRSQLRQNRSHHQHRAHPRR